MYRKPSICVPSVRNTYLERNKVKTKDPHRYIKGHKKSWSGLPAAGDVDFSRKVKHVPKLHVQASSSPPAAT